MNFLSSKKMFFLGIVIGIIVLLFLIFQFSGTPMFSLPTQSMEGEGQEQAPVAVKKIELIELNVKDCNQCVSFELFKQQLRDLNREFELKEIAFDSNEGKRLIEEYSIEFVPTIILKSVPAGLFGNWSEVGSVEEDGSLVFRAKIPVYWDLKEKRFVGLVSITELVDSSCENCFDPLQSNEMQLLLSNIKVMEVKRIDVNSLEGKKLLEKHHLDFAPALVFSREVRDYNFFNQFAPLGSIESDGSFVIRKKCPPYRDLDSNQVRGLLSLTIIEPTQCWACRDAKDMLNFLNLRLGLRFFNISVIDANSSDALYLSEQYSVQYAPAALIQGDLMLYEGMQDTWPKIGRVFKDGVYAFDNPLLLGQGYYYDFNSGQIVTVSSQQS